MNIKQTAVKEKKAFKCSNDVGRLWRLFSSIIGNIIWDMWNTTDRTLNRCCTFTCGRTCALVHLWRFLLKQEEMQETMAADGGMWLVRTDDISHAADSENLFCLSVELAVYPDTSSARTLKVLKLQAPLRMDVFRNDKGKWGWLTACVLNFPVIINYSVFATRHSFVTESISINLAWLLLN